MQKAQPIPAPNARAVASPLPRPRSTRGQHEYEGAAIKLAAAAGWEGDPNWELGGIRVRDAVGYVRKVLHEIHVAVRNPATATTPVIAQVLEHLAVTDPQAIADLTQGLEAFLEEEQAADRAQT